MIIIGKDKIGIEEIKKIIESNEKIEIDESGVQKVEESYSFLTQFIKGRVIYGINTGFGPMAQFRVEDSKRVELQQNLIRSHSTGLGNVLQDEEIKASMLCRLNSFLLGYSGVHPDVVELLKGLINKEVYPQIMEHGGVGASGDLVQLAHLALTLIGEAKVKFEGNLMDTKTAFNDLGLKPLEIRIREGIAIMNGTSVMTGIGLVNILKAKRLFQWSMLVASILTELVQSYNDSFSPELNEAKEHKGQHKVAQMISSILSDSQLISKREEGLYRNGTRHNVFKKKVQEYYSIRCIPQVIGPIYETILSTEDILLREMYSANDNPIIHPESNNVYHGGNFHGDYISLEMDKLRLAITKLSMIFERQINFLMNNKLNEMLPPFVNLGTLGLNFGMQGAQFTATSTTAENQALSASMYVHSIPNNNDNQDIVSMGTNAAVFTRKVIENTYEVLTVELLSLLQAVDYLQVHSKMSKTTKKNYDILRQKVDVIIEDNPLHETMKDLKAWLLENDPVL